MIVRGVLVEPELAPVVAQIIAEGVRRDPLRDSEELRRLLAEFDIVAVARPTSGQPVDGDPRPWRTIPEAAKFSRRSERSLRRDAKEGRIEARQTRERGPWRVRI